MRGDAYRHLKVSHLYAVADYVRGKRQHCYEQTLIGDIHTQTPGEYGVAAVPRRTPHGVGLSRLKA